MKHAVDNHIAISAGSPAIVIIGMVIVISISVAFVP